MTVAVAAAANVSPSNDTSTSPGAVTVMSTGEAGAVFNASVYVSCEAMPTVPSSATFTSDASRVTPAAPELDWITKSASLIAKKTLFVGLILIRAAAASTFGRLTVAAPLLGYVPNDCVNV